MVSVRAGPNTPGKFIVWFRNETTLLVLWQPPYPPGAYTHYKVRRLSDGSLAQSTRRATRRGSPIESSGFGSRLYCLCAKCIY